MKTKILVLHTHIGYGIKITAQAIAEKLQNSGKYDVRVGDIEEVEKGILTSIIQKTYSTLLAHISSFWGFLYQSRIVLFFMLPMRKFLASFKAKRVLQILREFQPAIVISTQTIPSGIISYLKAKGLYRGKLVIVFSDYHLHPFWLYNEADLYICNIAEQVAELKNLGVAEDKIILCGTQIRDSFFKPVPYDKACLAFGLLTTMPTVLVTSGGRSRNSIKEIFLQLLRSPMSFQIAVVCGKNAELKKELEKVSAPNRHPVRIFGYIDNLEVLMSASSVLVGKTGGPTMAEAVVKNLPMVLTDVRPGHEFANLEYLLQNEIVQYGRIPREVVFLVEEILAKKYKYNNQSAFEKIIRPSGSVDVVWALERFNFASDPLKVKNYQEI